MDIFEIEADQSAIGKFLGISRQAISKWNLPSRKKGKSVLYNLFEATTRRIENLKEQLENNTDQLTAARTELARYQSRRLALEIEQQEKNLIPFELVVKIFEDTFGRIKSQSETIPSKIGGIIAGVDDPIECEEMIRNSIRQVFIDFQNLDMEKYIDELEIEDHQIPDIGNSSEETAVKNQKDSKPTKRTKGKRLGQ